MKAAEEKKKPETAVTEDVGTPFPSNMALLLDSGIEVTSVIFHRTVKAASGEPEYAFYCSGKAEKPSRTAERILYTPHGVIIQQRDTRTKPKPLVTRIVPLANIVEVTAK